VHELAIRRLERDYPQARRRGFSRAVLKVFTDADNETRPVSLIPDLWWQAAPVDGWPGDMICIGVEDRNPVSATKLHEYAELWFDLDFVDCELRLYVTDRWGHELKSVSLHDCYYAQFDARQAEK